MNQPNLLHLLATGLERTIREMNPWWRNEPVPGVPPIRRWAFDPVINGIRKGLAPAVLLRGPRQVGKTTLQLQVIDQLLREGVPPNRILRLQFDELASLRELPTPILQSGLLVCGIRVAWRNADPGSSAKPARLCVSG